MSTKKEILLLREYEGIGGFSNNRDYLTESEKQSMDDGKRVFLSGIMQKSNTQNGNGRIYSRDILKREFDRYHPFVTRRSSLGETDHPDSAIVELKHASHIINKQWWDGDAWMGTIELLPTPNGRLLKGLVDSEIPLGISSRGLGSLRQGGGALIVEDDFQLVCFDMVADPSTPGAYMQPARALNEGELKLFENYSRNRMNVNYTSELNTVDSLIKEFMKI